MEPFNEQATFTLSLCAISKESVEKRRRSRDLKFDKNVRNYHKFAVFSHIFKDISRTIQDISIMEPFDEQATFTLTLCAI